MLVSDVQEVEPHGTMLKLAVADASTLGPKPMPCSVSDAPPVRAAFGLFEFDTTGASNVNNAMAVPIIPPTDSVAACLRLAGRGAG